MKILNEHYHGPLYHYTVLPHLYNILENNIVYCNLSDNVQPYRRGTVDNETGDYYPFICLTRNKDYNIRLGYGVQCRLTFDSDKLMRLRYAKLYPINWSNIPKIDNISEFEERLYNTDIYPLDKYVERIDIFIDNLDEDASTDLEDELYHQLYGQFKKDYPHASDNEYTAYINQYMIDKIINNRMFKDKIIVHDNRRKLSENNHQRIHISEKQLNKIIKESLKIVLKK